MVVAPRPLSPHLQIYRWRITMWLSSLHRMTGLLLSFGALALTCWLIAIATGPDAYVDVMRTFGAGWFKVPLVGWTFCFFYHLANGIRHLFWDAGMGYGKSQIRSSGLLVIAATVIATAAFAFVAIF
jgi:succinate dehydrogenase / fumarate reductase cytochrome b subunit